MPALNTVPFVSVDNMMRLVHAVGIEAITRSVARADMPIFIFRIVMIVLVRRPCRGMRKFSSVCGVIKFAN